MPKRSAQKAEELPVTWDVDLSEAYVLGFDPGFALMGYGLIHREKAIDYGVIQTPAELPVAERLGMIESDVLELVHGLPHKPDEVVIELPFFNRDNPNQSLVLAAIGVLRLALYKLGYEQPICLHQSSVKSAVAEYGAGKKEMKLAVAEIFRLDKPPSPDDVADALGAAFAAQQGKRNKIL